MKVTCYEEGYDAEQGEEYDLGLKTAPWAIQARGPGGSVAAARDSLLVAAHDYAKLKDDGDLNVVVIPADDEARALPGWRSDDDEPQYRMFIVETRTEWFPREVDTFNPYARIA